MFNSKRFYKFIKKSTQDFNEMFVLHDDQLILTFTLTVLSKHLFTNNVLGRVAAEGRKSEKKSFEPTR